MFGKNKQQDPDMEIFTIYDSKSQSYEIPTFAKNKNCLIRDVINIFRDPQSNNNKFKVNAEDYSIFKIAYFDKSTGTLTTQNMEHVANMHDLRAMAEPQTVVDSALNRQLPRDLGIAPT